MDSKKPTFSDEIQELVDGLLSGEAIDGISYAYELGDNPNKQEAMHALIYALSKVEAEVKLVIIDILTQTDFFGDEIVLPFCELLKDSDAEVRAHAAAAVGMTKDPQAVDALISAMQDEMDPDARYAQMSALAALGDTKASKHIQKWLNSERWQDRYHAIDALGNLACEESLPVIIKTLRDPHPKVRENAILSAGYYDSPKIREILLDLLDDDDVGVSAAAIYMLGEYKATEAIPPFIDLLKCDDEELLILVIEALGKIRNKETAKYLIPHIDSPFPNVRKVVIETLKLFNLDDYLSELMEEIIKDPKVEFLHQMLDERNIKDIDNLKNIFEKIEYPDWVLQLVKIWLKSV